MHWYDGSIAEAVTLSKQRNAIFVVFVEGDNDMSQEMSQVIDDGVVVNRLSDTNNFLAVKLKSGSPHYTHFAQIYQFVPVPSLFFIGRNGTPLEVVCPGVQPDNLASRIDRILEEHHKEKPSTIAQPSQSSRPAQPQTPTSQPQAPATQPQAPSTQPQAPSTQPQAPATQPQAAATQPQAPATGLQEACAQPVQPSTSAQNIKEQTVNFMQAEAARAWVKPQTETASDEKPSGSVPVTVVHEVTRSGVEYDVVCDGQVCARRPRPDQPATSRPIPRPSPAPPAPAVSGSLSDDKVERAKELIEAKKREKAEKEKELERQKELERRATGQGVVELKRWQADQELKQIQEERKREKLENNLARQRILEQIAQDRAERRARDAPAPPAAPATSTPPPTSGDGSPRARIQFKMPDGTSHTAHFDADGTVSDVRQYVANNLQLSESSFSIWTAFPRRELADNDATLRGLQLTPSAALLVLPRRQVTAVQSPSNYATFLTFLTQLFTSYILEPARAAYAWLAGRVLPSPPPPAPRAARTPPPAPVGVRRRTNVHRLAGEADDDNNTWNGNSTQQM